MAECWDLGLEQVRTAYARTRCGGSREEYWTLPENEEWCLRVRSPPRAYTRARSSST